MLHKNGVIVAGIRGRCVYGCLEPITSPTVLGGGIESPSMDNGAIGVKESRASLRALAGLCTSCEKVSSQCRREAKLPYLMLLGLWHSGRN